MKKFFLASALTMVTVSSVTATTKHGFYVGAGLSALAGHHDATLNYVQPLFPTETNVYGFSKSAVGGDIMLGYMATIHNFVVGAEVDYLFGNVNKTNSVIVNPTTTKTIKVDSTGGAWGAGIRFGYSCLDRIMPYLRLGIENRRFKMFHFSQDTGLPDVTEISSSSRKTAFAPGIGMDFKVSKNVALGLEYRCAFYGSITKSGNNPGVPRDVDFRVKPRVSTAILSLKYVFGSLGHS